MKTKLFFFAMLCLNLSFGQNRSLSPIVNTIPPGTPPAPNEIFRFQPGNVTQLDLGSGFGFTADRWFSMGRVVTGTNTAYGLRFQLPNKAVTFGYQNITSNNPRIEWIGTGSNLGNLEFRVANNFNSTTSTLLATMKSNGNTVFSGDPVFATSVLLPNAQVAIDNGGKIGLYIGSASTSFANGSGFEVVQSSASFINTGGKITVADASGSIPVLNVGLDIEASSEYDNAIGIRATTSGNAFFQAAIQGTTINNNGNQFAGFFNGDVFISGSYGPSDAKLKDNVKQENTVLVKLAKLKPVSYDYKKMPELNLPQGIQHGFIAQELAAVFPELTKDIKKPILDKEGKQTSIFEFKSVNYNGLISVLTAGINELSQELQLLKEEINTLKETIASGATSKSSSIENTGGAFMKQNIPNPFLDQTTIRYQLPNGTNTAAIIVFDLNGLLIKNYSINSNQSELIIRASDVGRGLFIYSLVQNGQQLVTKRMIIQ